MIKKVLYIHHGMCLTKPCWERNKPNYAPRLRGRAYRITKPPQVNTVLEKGCMLFRIKSRLEVFCFCASSIGALQVKTSHYSPRLADVCSGLERIQYKHKELTRRGHFVAEIRFGHHRTTDIVLQLPVIPFALGALELKSNIGHHLRLFDKRVTTDSYWRDSCMVVIGRWLASVWW